MKLSFLLFFAALQSSPPLPGEEGDLANRSFLPEISAAAQARLDDFENFLRQGKPAEAATALSRLLESADAESELLSAGDRRDIGLREHLEIRLSTLSEPARTAYQNAVGEPSQRAWEAAGRDEKALRAIAREFPGSSAAVEALLRLGDLAFERGDAVGAAAFYLRTRETRGRERARSAEPFILSKAAVPSFLQTWTAPIEEEPSAISRPIRHLATDRSLLTQTGKFLYEHDTRGKRLLAFPLDRHLFDRELILRGADPGLTEETPRALRMQWFSAENSPWDGESLFLMHSAENRPPFARTLAAIRLEGEAAARRAQVVWQRGWGSEEGGELADLVLSEGFFVHGNRVYLAAQRSRGESASFALCLDARDGRLLWKRFLCKGTRFSPRPADRLKNDPEGPPTALAPIPFSRSVLFPTNTGILAALDLEDGAYLWALRTARSKENEPRWQGANLSRRGDLAWYAPEDSGWLYSLRPEHGEYEETSPAPRFEAAPLQKTGLRHFLGPSSHGPIFLETRDGRWRLWGADLATGRPVLGSFLPRGEDPFGAEIFDHLVLIYTEHSLRVFDVSKELRLREEILASSLPGEAAAKPVLGAAMLPSGVVAIVPKMLVFLPWSALKKN